MASAAVTNLKVVGDCKTSAVNWRPYYTDIIYLETMKIALVVTTLVVACRND